MNCKPGDLAVIVRALCQENIGILVTVTSVGEMGADGWEWVTDSFRPTPTVWQESGRPAFHDVRAWCPDAWLRPVRDPGDDAVDETLLWLPSPHKEAA